MRLDAPGVRIEVPAGWEVEVDRGAGVEPAPDAIRTPRIHAANFALPMGRGDFGSGAVETMRAGDILICVLEESPAAAPTHLHRTSGIPALDAASFRPRALQRPLPGLVGTQAFFRTDAGRAFVLYVVLGDGLRRRELVATANSFLTGVRFTG